MAILAHRLPLHQFPRELISKGVDLHHFGMFDASSDALDRPLWVSDDYACAHEYKNFGIRAPRYTKLVTSEVFEIINLNGMRLQPIAMDMKIYDHKEWNKCLAAYLCTAGVLGIVYAGREIFLPEPGTVIGACSSIKC